MKKFANVAAQGDLLIRRIKKLPRNLKEIRATDEVYVVAHSETGHHHVIDAQPNVHLFTTGDPMISYLQVVEATDAAETVLKHLRSFDTHEAILFPSGVYELRRQREYTPQGLRRVED